MAEKRLNITADVHLVATNTDGTPFAEIGPAKVTHSNVPYGAFVRIQKQWLKIGQEMAAELNAMADEKVEKGGT